MSLTVFQVNNLSWSHDATVMVICFMKMKNVDFIILKPLAIMI